MTTTRDTKWSCLNKDFQVTSQSSTCSLYSQFSQWPCPSGPRLFSFILWEGRYTGNFIIVPQITAVLGANKADGALCANEWPYRANAQYSHQGNCISVLILELSMLSRCSLSNPLFPYSSAELWAATHSASWTSCVHPCKSISSWRFAYNLTIKQIFNRIFQCVSFMALFSPMITLYCMKPYKEWGFPLFQKQKPEFADSFWVLLVAILRKSRGA